MLNINLLGEIYDIQQEDTLTIIDLDINSLLYKELSDNKKILCYPIFVNNIPQMVYETVDKHSYKRLVDYKAYLEENKLFDSLENELHKKILHRRVNSFLESKYYYTIFDDFNFGSNKGWYDIFPPFLNQSLSILKRDKFNRIFSGKVINKDLFIGDNFLKVIVDKPYTTNNKNIIIKRKPEDNLNISYYNENNCTTVIKFKTKNIKEIFEMVQDINVIHDYVNSEICLSDFINKIIYVKKLIETEKYMSEEMSYKILKVLSYCMYRCDLASSNKLTKDIMVKLLIGDTTYLKDYIDYVDSIFKMNTLAYLNTIYNRSPYRYKSLGVCYNQVI